MHRGVTIANKHRLTISKIDTKIQDVGRNDIPFIECRSFFPGIITKK